MRQLRDGIFVSKSLAGIIALDYPFRGGLSFDDDLIIEGEELLMHNWLDGPQPALLEVTGEAIWPLPRVSRLDQVTGIRSPLGANIVRRRRGPTLALHGLDWAGRIGPLSL